MFLQVLLTRFSNRLCLLGMTVFFLNSCASEKSDCASCSEVELSSASGGNGVGGTSNGGSGGSAKGISGGASATSETSGGGVPATSGTSGGGVPATSGTFGGGASHTSLVVGIGGSDSSGGTTNTNISTVGFEMPERCTTVSGEVAKSIVQSGATLVDVREPSEFASGAIDGARNIPVGSLSEHLSELELAKPVVVYCKSGGRAAQAMTLLCDAGYEVFSLGAMSNYPN